MPDRRPLVQRAPALASAASLSLPDIPAGAVLSAQIAAQLHGLPVLTTPPRPTAIVASNCRPPGDRWHVRRSELAIEDVVVTPDGVRVTGLRRTLADCGRTSPFYDAVAMMDAALRFALLTPGQLHRLAAEAAGPGSLRLRRAVRWSDGRADSAQESVGRVALGLLGMPATPQFYLLEGPYEHPFDLGLRWAKVVIDLQSKQAHEGWSATRKDIGIQGVVNLQRGWKLVWSVPDEVLPNPCPFAAKVLAVVAMQPGKQCPRLRRRHTDETGQLRYPWQVSPRELELAGW